MPRSSLENRIYFGDISFREYFEIYSRQTIKTVPKYLKSLVPIISWLPKYNRKWFWGDLVAGVTVGLMVVPQSLAYAKLANLPVVYGLYTSYIGTILYTLMGNSREIAVGPSAVLSLLVGNTIMKIQTEIPDASEAEIATLLSFLSGLITLGLGAFKLGALLDLIPHPVVMGFTTGSAFTIILTQLPSLLGIPNTHSSDPTLVTIKNLIVNAVEIKWLNFSFGVLSLVFLQMVGFVAKKWTNRLALLRYLKVASNALCIVVFTVISCLLFINNPETNLAIVKAVPEGFGHIGAPNLRQDLISNVSSEIIPVVLIGLIEHVAIAKAFARKASYSIDASQELVALGVGNFFGSFFSGYPATGSFSRSAVNSQSGVKTPLGASWAGLVVILSLWVLTPAFYYIPNATLASIIVNSATSLITQPSIIMDLWKLQKTDCFVFVVAFVATFLAGAEYGIGCSLMLSFLILVYHVARPHFSRLAQVIGRNHLYIDVDHPGYSTEQPLPGVIIFHPQESLLFPNIDYLREKLLDQVLSTTKPGPFYTPPQEPLWCEDLVARGVKLRQNAPEKSFPALRAIVFDFSSVNRIDASGLQGLRDIRDQLIQYAGTSLPSHSEKMEPSPFLTPNLHVSQFELHFVSTHTKVLKSLELAGVTCPIVPELSSEVDFSSEPIVSTGSKFIHLSVFDAISHLSTSF